MSKSGHVGFVMKKRGFVEFLRFFSFYQNYFSTFAAAKVRLFTLKINN